jgi:hypothetical protein
MTPLTSSYWNDGACASTLEYISYVLLAVG